MTSIEKKIGSDEIVSEDMHKRIILFVFLKLVIKY